MSEFFSTRDVCARIGRSEPALRHILRRPGAPRPTIHPSAYVFLWTQADIEALIGFLARSDEPDDAPPDVHEANRERRGQR